MKKYFYGPKFAETSKATSVIDLVQGFGCEVNLNTQGDVDVIISDANGTPRISWMFEVPFSASNVRPDELLDDIHNMVFRDLLKIITRRKSPKVSNIYDYMERWEEELYEYYDEKNKESENDE